MVHRFFVILGIGLMLLVQFGCIGYKTFPYQAQAGDTITLGGGLEMGLGNEFMDRTNTTVMLTQPDNLAFVPRDLSTNMQALFHLMPDPRSAVWNTNMFLGPLSQGRPFETGIALDLPADLATGVYQLEVSSTAINNVWKPFLQIIDDPAVPGEPNCFADQSAACSAMNDVKQLERMPFTRVSFNSFVMVGAMEIVMTYNTTTATDPNQLNVISPRVNYGSAGFGTTNRDHLKMFYWKPDAATGQITVHYVCPNGVSSEHMFFDVVRPVGMADPITGVTVKAFDVNGADISTMITASSASH